MDLLLGNLRLSQNLWPQYEATLSKLLVQCFAARTCCWVLSIHSNYTWLAICLSCNQHPQSSFVLAYPKCAFGEGGAYKKNIISTPNIFATSHLLPLTLPQYLSSSLCAPCTLSTTSIQCQPSFPSPALIFFPSFPSHLPS